MVTRQLTRSCFPPMPSFLRRYRLCRSELESAMDGFLGFANNHSATSSRNRRARIFVDNPLKTKCGLQSSLFSNVDTFRLLHRSSLSIYIAPFLTLLISTIALISEWRDTMLHV